MEWDFFCSTRKPNVNSSVTQVVLIGSCRCRTTPPQTHGSSAGGIGRKFGEKRISPPWNFWQLLQQSGPLEKSFCKTARSFFFCDNTSAMSAAVHGYARFPERAALSNTLHLALAALKCTPFFEWVPSLANCADIPSRPQGVAERAFYARVKVTRWSGKMRFPSMTLSNFLNLIPFLNSKYGSCILP